MTHWPAAATGMAQSQARGKAVHAAMAPESPAPATRTTANDPATRIRHVPTYRFRSVCLSNHFRPTAPWRLRPTSVDAIATRSVNIVNIP